VERFGQHGGTSGKYGRHVLEDRNCQIGANGGIDYFLGWVGTHGYKTQGDGSVDAACFSSKK
jgi:hypothetical protein